MYLIVLSIAVVVVALMSAGCLDATAGEKKVAKTETVAEAKGNPTQESLRKKLQKLADSESPSKLSMGAMCYKMAAPPNRVEYVCPTCQNKTLYLGENERWNKQTQFLSWELPACRRLMKQVKDLNVQLDESALCKTCKPDAAKREVILVVSYKDRKEPHKITGITLEDIQLVSEFAAGKTVHKGRQGREKPLKEYIPRLEKLLGIKLKED